MMVPSLLANPPLQEQLHRVKVASLEVIFRALQEARARYLVVGGLAVIAHGYVRLTGDLDLVLDLEPVALSRTLEALGTLGYHPIIPVPLLDLAHPEWRQDWTEHRQMNVFRLISDHYSDVSVDILLKESFPFETEFATGIGKDMTPDVKVHVVSVSTLIRLKLDSNHNEDRVDIDKLRKLYRENGKIDETDPWFAGTWEGAELAQLRREAAQPFRDHLIWLEEMTEFADKLSKAPWRKEGFPPRPPEVP